MRPSQYIAVALLIEYHRKWRATDQVFGCCSRDIGRIVFGAYEWDIPIMINWRAFVGNVLQSGGPNLLIRTFRWDAEPGRYHQVISTCHVSARY